MGKIMHYIPGFRSGVRWKKVIAILYYSFALLSFIGGWGEGLFFLASPFFVFSLLDLILHKKKAIPIYKALVPFVLALSVMSTGIANFPEAPAKPANLETAKVTTPVASQSQASKDAITQVGTENDQQTIAKEDTNSENNKESEQETPEAVKSQDAQVTLAPPGTLKVHFIDVGQADSILVQTPSGKTMLIDAGNNADGDTVVSYLKSQGVKQIDVLVGTHPHEDHIGGMDTVIYSFPIGQIYMPKASSTTKTFEDVLNAIKSKGLKVKTATAGVTIELDPSIQIIMYAPNGSSYEDLNNYSAVIKLTYSNTSFMFDGDAEDVSENEMLSKGYSLKADVLKVGHHGSSSSTTEQFLKAVSPKYAVISVGAGNSYGHPSQETLNKLAAANIQIYRTDEAGTIIATSDGNVITFDKKASTVKPHAPPTTTQSKSNASIKSNSPSSNSGSSTAIVVPVPKTSNSSSNSDNDVTVYITKTGSKYHVDGCQYLAKSKIPIKLSDAKARGYTPCSRCHPPQ